MYTEFNETPPIYIPHLGDMLQHLQEIREAGRKILSTADIIRERLRLANSSQEPVVKANWGLPLRTSDLVHAHSGEIVYVPNFFNLTSLENLTELSQMTSSADIQDFLKEKYLSLTFEREKLTLGRPLSLKEAKSDPFWVDAIAQGDKSLIRHYSNYVFINEIPNKSLIECPAKHYLDGIVKRYTPEREIMGIWIHERAPPGPIIIGALGGRSPIINGTLNDPTTLYLTKPSRSRTK